MAAKASELCELVTQFKAEVLQGKKPYSAAKLTLTKIKVIIVMCPSASAGSARSAASTAARDALELACVLSVRDSDIKSFDRHFAQLHPYYLNERITNDKDGAEMRSMVLGLNLMHLLVENKLSEFHSQLELIPVIIRQQRNTAFPILLEQYLMEGNFSKLFTSGKELPDPIYSEFMDQLFDFAREEIVSCCEAAYTNLQLSDMQRMMGLEGSPVEDVTDFFEERKNCRLENGTVFFDTHADTKLSKSDVASFDLARQHLMYATELERIV